MIIFKEDEGNKTHFHDSRTTWSSFYDDVKSVGKHDSSEFNRQEKSWSIMESWNGLYCDDWDDLDD